jgi:hypothetical protein
MVIRAGVRLGSQNRQTAKEGQERVERDHDFGSWITSKGDASARDRGRRADRRSARNTRVHWRRRGGHHGHERDGFHQPTVHCGRCNHYLYGGLQDLIDRKSRRFRLHQPVAPHRTGVTSLSGGTGVYVGATQVGECYNNSTTTAAQCAIYSGDSVAASTAAKVILDGVVNPSAGGYTLGLSTSSDTTAATSPTYNVTAAQSVSSPSVSISPPSSAAGATT